MSRLQGPRIDSKAPAGMMAGHTRENRPRAAQGANKDIIFLVVEYWRHLVMNLRPAGRALVLCLWHVLHGLIPVKYTSHEYWNLNLEGKDGRK